MRPRDRLAGGLVRGLGSLPRPVRRALAGRPKVVDGQQLDPEVQLLIRLMGSSSDAPHESPAAARADRSQQARVFRGAVFPVARVEQLSIPGPAGSIAARLYVPKEAISEPPLLVFFHGGGWVVCDLDTHDNACRFLAREAGVRVLSIDYRLGPEHPFPAAVDDAARRPPVRRRECGRAGGGSHGGRGRRRQRGWKSCPRGFPAGGRRR